MTRKLKTFFAVLIGFGLLPALSQSAAAYTGPGAGLTAIGSLLAVVATILFGLIGFVWYPIKRFMKSRRKVEAEKTTPAAQ